MREVAELNGDGIAAELRDAIHALNDALGNLIAFRPVDCTVDRREASSTALDEGIELTRALGAAMKYPTVTQTDSPNQVLRDKLDLAVIHRPCRTYPGVSSNYTGKIDLHVVCAASGDANDVEVDLAGVVAADARVGAAGTVDHGQIQLVAQHLVWAVRLRVRGVLHCCTEGARQLDPFIKRARGGFPAFDAPVRGAEGDQAAKRFVEGVDGIP